MTTATTIKVTQHPARPDCWNVWHNGWCGFIWELDRFPEPRYQAETPGGYRRDAQPDIESAARTLLERRKRGGM